MAGTNSKQMNDAADLSGAIPAPAVILVEPQLGENIGMAARAMLNCGLTDLRLVAPRDGWPSDPARAAAAGADAVIDGARVFETTNAAIADLTFVLATTARPRDMTKRVLEPRAAIAEIHAAALIGGRCGVLFGKESKGLTNDDVALAGAVLQAPLNPGFSSLNLAQAVFLVGYEWRLATLGAPNDGLTANETASEPNADPSLVMPKDTRPADQAEMMAMYDHLERELETCGFLTPPERAPIMARNLRNLFGRARLTEQEVRTLRGVISALRRGPRNS